VSAEAATSANLRDAVTDARGSSRKVAAACVAVLVFSNGVDTQPRDVSRCLTTIADGRLLGTYKAWVNAQSQTNLRRIEGLKLPAPDASGAPHPATFREHFPQELDAAKNKRQEEWELKVGSTLTAVGPEDLADVSKWALQGPLPPLPVTVWRDQRAAFFTDLAKWRAKPCGNQNVQSVQLALVGEEALEVRTRFRSCGDPHVYPLPFPRTMRMRGLLGFVEQDDSWQWFVNVLEEEEREEVHRSSIASGLLALAATASGRGVDDGMRLAGAEVTGMGTSRAQQLVEGLNKDKESLTVYGLTLSGSSILVAVPWILLFLVGVLAANLRVARDLVAKLETTDEGSSWRAALRPRWQIEVLEALACLALPSVALLTLWSQLLWEGVDGAEQETPGGVVALALIAVVCLHNAWASIRLWSASRTQDPGEQVRGLLRREWFETWIFFPERARPELLQLIAESLPRLGKTTVVTGSPNAQAVSALTRGNLRVEVVTETKSPSEFCVLLDARVLVRHRHAPNRWAIRPGADEFGELIVEEHAGSAPWTAWLARRAARGDGRPLAPA